jgi:hypothetical protein
MKGIVAREIYEWLSTNYPITNDADDPAFLNDHDWSIAGHSLDATIEWYFSKHLDDIKSIPVVLTSDEQVVMFKLNFGDKIILEY